MYFDELALSDEVLDALWDMHFDECTPVQEKTIPVILDGRDVISCAQTGTGKTAAYILPLLTNLAFDDHNPDKLNAIIMAPTRELAQQIDQQMEVYGIQQMFDTVTCQRNITIPFLRITDELIRNTKEPELKEYIQERYRKPWLKRMSELPFD